MAQGTVLGQAVWLLDGVTVAQVDLVSAASIRRDVREPLTFWQRLRGLFGSQTETFRPYGSLI